MIGLLLVGWRFWNREIAILTETFKTFEARDCLCFHEPDREKVLGFIRKIWAAEGTDGVDAFNEFVRTKLSRMVFEQMGSRSSFFRNCVSFPLIVGTDDNCEFW